MARFFALADVLLVTLKRNPIFSLTMPGKIQSYLACAKPIIAAVDGEGAASLRRLARDSFAPPKMLRHSLVPYRSSARSHPPHALPWARADDSTTIANSLD
ncbi:MAG: hypothetical protein Q8R16_04425 [bacterium]|nr:hypothetical protein [bacterium]